MTKYFTIDQLKLTKANIYRFNYYFLNNNFVKDYNKFVKKNIYLLRINK